MKRFLDFINEIKSPNLEKAREKQDQERLELKRRHANEVLRAQEKDIDISKREKEKQMRARAARRTQEQVEITTETEHLEKEPPPEVGTDEIVRRYKKFVPNQ
jgi:hypothetical protein